MAKFLNYGCIEKNSKRYRKALRECRKNKKYYNLKKSFDDSETWNLDIVILKYCLNNKIHDYNILKKLINDNIDYLDEIEEKFQINDIDKINEIYDSTIKEILNELIYKESEKFGKFILPRLKRFKILTNGYPPDMKEEEWNEYIQNTINDIEYNKDYTKLINKFHSFWW